MLKILTGPNSWLIKRAIAEFDTADISRYQGSELTPGELADILDAQSLFSTKRTIVIDELSANKAGWERLTELTNELASDPDLTLIIIENKPDGRSKLIKQAKQAGWLIDYPLPKDIHQATTYLEAEAQQLQLQLQPGVARMIIDRVGLDTWAGHMALEKLASASATISAELVEKYIAPSLEVNVFKIVDELFAGRALAVAELIDEMDRTSANAYQFFGLISSQISNLLIIKILGKTVATTELKLHPFVAGKLANVANQLSLPTIKQMVSILAQTDLQLKTSGQHDWTLIKLALVQIAQLI
jgi:DNA polymerase III, delta subunit